MKFGIQVTHVVLLIILKTIWSFFLRQILSVVKEVRLNLLSSQTHEIWFAGYSCGTIYYSKKTIWSFFLDKEVLLVIKEVLLVVKEVRLNRQLSMQTWILVCRLLSWYYYLFLKRFDLSSCIRRFYWWSRRLS